MTMLIPAHKNVDFSTYKWQFQNCKCRFQLENYDSSTRNDEPTWKCGRFLHMGMPIQRIPAQFFNANADARPSTVKWYISCISTLKWPRKFPPPAPSSHWCSRKICKTIQLTLLLSNKGKIMKGSLGIRHRGERGEPILRAQKILVFFTYSRFIRLYGITIRTLQRMHITVCV